MPDLLTDIEGQIQARLKELKAAVDEYTRLENAAEALDGQGSSSDGSDTPRRRSGRGRTAGRGVSASRKVAGGRKRAPRGANREAVLQAVKKQPGASVPEIAKASGVQVNVVYQVRSRLLQEGALNEDERPDGRKGYVLGKTP
jgi:hypothetical protein